MCAWLMVRSRTDTCECQNRGVKVSAKPYIRCLYITTCSVHRSTSVYYNINTHFRCLSRNHSDHVWIIKLFFSFICFSIVTYTYIWVTCTQKQEIKNENRLNIMYLFEIIILILPIYYNNILHDGGIPLVIFPRETCRLAWRSALQQWILSA